jgi:hypothetical protein
VKASETLSLALTLGWQTWLAAKTNWVRRTDSVRWGEREICLGKILNVVLKFEQQTRKISYVDAV